MTPIPQITEYHVADQQGRQSKMPRLPIIELLAVVVIVGILAAIIFPVIAKTRENANRASCQSNLARIGQAMLHYTYDYDDKFPQLATIQPARSIGLNNFSTWRQAISPYVMDKETYKCTKNPIREDANIIDGFPQSYEVADTGPIRLNKSIELSKIASPAQTILLFEENGHTPQAQHIGALWDQDTGEAGWTHILYANHFGGSLYLFCDGHTKRLPPMATITSANMWHLNVDAPVSPRARQKLEAAEKNF